MGLPGKTVWERNIWLEIGDSRQTKMVLFRKVGALTGDVNQNGAFRENESGKGTFGQKYGGWGKSGAFHRQKNLFHV